MIADSQTTPSDSQKIPSDWFHDATKAMNSALQTTARLQKETMDWWAQMMSGTQSIREWRERASAMVLSAIAATNKRTEEYLHVMDEAYRTGLDCVLKAFESGEVHSVEDVREAVNTLWGYTLRTLMADNQAFIRADAKAKESCAELVSKTAPVCEGWGIGTGS